MAPTTNKRRNTGDEDEPARKKSSSNTNDSRREPRPEVPLRSRQQEEEEDGGSPEPEYPYQIFEPTILQVPRHVIDASWTALSAPAIEKITSIFQTVERATVMRLKDEEKRDQASNVINTVIRRVTRKIGKGMPFPPPSLGKRENKERGDGREADFDAERIIDAGREAERKLGPLLHSVALLKSEIRREEELLEQETKALERLERNAKEDRARRRAEVRKFHPSLRKPEGVVEGLGAEGLSLAEDKDDVVLKEEELDEDVARVVRELHNHLDSMDNNLKQVDGIEEALMVAEAELKNQLIRHLGEDKFMQIMMG